MKTIKECFYKKIEWCHRNDMRLMECKTKLFTPLVDNNNDYIYCCSSHTPRDTITHSFIIMEVVICEVLQSIYHVQR